jgi:hypothetical protein
MLVFSLFHSLILAKAGASSILRLGQFRVLTSRCKRPSDRSCDTKPSTQASLDRGRFVSKAALDVERVVLLAKGFLIIIQGLWGVACLSEYNW